MKFLIDTPLSPDVAQWLRGRGHEAVHAVDLGMYRTPDGEILDYARQNQQIIVTADLDFPRLFALSDTQFFLLDNLLILRYERFVWSDQGFQSVILLNSFQSHIPIT